MPTGALNVKRNDYTKNPKEFDIFTPSDICNFIQDIVSVNKYKKIADICCGEGNLSQPFIKNDCKSIGIDTVDYSKEFPGKFIKSPFIVFPEKDFETEEEQKAYNQTLEINKKCHQELHDFKPELILCNPPWNKCPGKLLYPFEILKKIIELFWVGIPIVLFTPMGLLLNRRYGAKREKEFEALVERGLELTSICSMPIDAFFPGNKEKGQQWQILFFNIYNIKSHYWYTQKLKEKYGKI